MDVLDRVVVPGRDLLVRVDAALSTGGAPGDHEIWPLLRRVGALPSDALEYVAGLRADPLGTVAVELRTRADGYAGHRARLEAAAEASGWRGPAGEAFAARCRALTGHLGEAEHADEASMAGRLVALMSYLDDIAGWVTGTRADLAAVLAKALGSAEAVRLRSAPLGETRSPALPDRVPPGPALAAATVGAAVLRSVDAALRAGYELHERWSPRLGELAFRMPLDAGPSGPEAGPGATRVEF